MTPLIAWAAVAPDGTIVPGSIRSSSDAVWEAVGRAFGHYGDDRDIALAQDAGWRVVPVKIEVMEGQKDG